MKYTKEHLEWYDSRSYNFPYTQKYYDTVFIDLSVLEEQFLLNGRLPEYKNTLEEIQEVCTKLHNDNNEGYLLFSFFVMLTVNKLTSLKGANPYFNKTKVIKWKRQR